MAESIRPFANDDPEMKFKLHNVSLLWRILFSTSIAITVLFAAMGWLLQDQFVRIASVTLGDEARASFRAYESLWKARGDQLLNGRVHGGVLPADSRAGHKSE